MGTTALGGPMPETSDQGPLDGLMFSDSHDISEYTTYMNTQQQANDPVFDSDPWANSQMHNPQTHNSQVHNPHPYRPIRSTSRERHLQANFDALAGIQ